METIKRGVIVRKLEVVLDYGKKMHKSDGIIASYTLAKKRMKKYTTKQNIGKYFFTS